jgi:hypothetical protein
MLLLLLMVAAQRQWTAQIDRLGRSVRWKGL